MRRIEKLEIRSFRGATKPTEIPFDTSKPLVVVFGENGTGKSTIVDALDFIANGQVGSLEDRKSTTVKDSPSLGQRDKDVQITLRRADEAWTGTLKGATTQVSPLEGRPKIEILRRSQLLNFIEAQPKERYDAFKPFIDVDAVEKCEAELKDAVKEANDDSTKAASEKVRLSGNLSDLWEENGSLGESWEEWAATQASREQDDFATRPLYDLYTAINDNYEPSRSTFSKAASVVADATNALDNHSMKRPAVEDAFELQSPKLVGVLESAKDLLSDSWSRDECPVCRQGIDNAALSAEIAGSLDAMTEMVEFTKTERLLTANQTDAEKALERSRTQLSAATAAVAEKARGVSFNVVTSITAAHAGDDTNAAQTQLAEALVEVKDTIYAEAQRLDKIRNQLTIVQKSYQEYLEASELAAESSAIATVLAETHESLKKIRREFVNGILEDVSVEVRRLYEAIHPDEVSKAGSLTMASKKRASLEQTAFFAGEERTPQSCFSDAHLDTLGFCYWLALAKRQNPSETILVLDDVFTSVDASHLGRTAALLKEECQCFVQLFVFTHNRSWQRQFLETRHFDRCDGIELLFWYPESGIEWSRRLPRVDSLAETIAAFRNNDRSATRTNVAIEAGRLLERLLEDLLEAYRCKTPFRRNPRFTLDRLKKHTKPSWGQFEAKCDGSTFAARSVNDILVDTFGNDYVRNQLGAHADDGEDEISNAEVLQFADLVLELGNAVTCPHCRELPPNQNAKCGCGRTRLT